MGQLFHIQKSKKGVSLIYVIIASAALIILSGVVAVSAMRNMDLTMNSSYSRSAYISDKSAIEFAKGLLEQQYEAGSFKNFAITSGDNPYGWAFNDRNNYNVGTNCFATCDITPDASDSNKYTATITAGYPSSQTDKKKLLKMVYTTYCTLGGGGFPFLVTGCRYGSKQIVSNDVEGGIRSDARSPALLDNASNATSDYAAVFNLPVRNTVKGKTSGFLQAPQVFFFGGYSESDTIDSGFRDAALYTDSHNTEATIKSNFIYINSDKIVDAGTGNHLNISPISGKGYIYFANSSGCSVCSSDGTVINNYKNKLYSYSSQKDIFSSGCVLQSVDNSDEKEKILKENNVKYVEDNHEHFACSETYASYTFPYSGKADWTDNGCIKGSNGGSEQNVFMYLDKSSGNDPTSAWADGSSPSYAAEKICLMYVTHDTHNPEITIGAGTTITFNLINNDDEPGVDSDAVSFCGQKQDGAGDSSDGLTLLQGNGGGKPGSFILKSKSGSTVKLTVYHKLVIKKSGKSGGSGYTLTAGTYTVPSGTDLFSNTVTEGSFTPESGSGSGSDSGGSGSGGGFSGGEYSWPKN